MIKQSNTKYLNYILANKGMIRNINPVFKYLITTLIIVLKIKKFSFESKYVINIVFKKYCKIKYLSLKYKRYALNRILIELTKIILTSNKIKNKLT